MPGFVSILLTALVFLTGLGFPARAGFTDGVRLSVAVNPLGTFTTNFSTAGRPVSLSGPGVNLGMTYDFSGGGVKVTGTNASSGKDFLTENDAEGIARRREATGKNAFAWDGNPLAGTSGMTAAGFTDQKVETSYGPALLPLERTRSDGSGVSYVWNADGSLASFTEFDGPDNGGAARTFAITRDADGRENGITSTGLTVARTWNLDGTLATVNHQTKDADGNTVSYQASYPSWFDDQPLVETFGGPLAGYEIRRNYDAETGEAVRVELRKNGQPVHAVDYGRDVVGRFSTVAASGATAFQAEYTYPSDLEEKLTWPGGNTLRTLAGDGTGTLGSIATITDAGENYSASYSFTGTRRTGAEISIHGLGIANWDYVFANLATGTGSLQSAVLNNAPRFSYAQNAAGNRVSGAANIANQYAIAAQPGARFYTVEGSVKPGATVKISRTGGPTVDVPTAADGSFAARLPVPEDGTNPVKIPLTVTGTLPGAGDDGTDAIADDKRTIVLTPAEMPIIYGVHGSLASDWRWNYHWDIEGRLAGMDTNPAARNAGMPNLTLRFSYDDLGRRIGKSAVYRKRVGTALVVTRTVTSSYVYDNWKLIAEEINDSTTSGPVTRYYTWGKDIAGSLDETGGVGGLLAIHENGGTYVPVYDGSGNIVALTDAQTGAQLAAWQRGPFGEPLEKRGDTSLCSFGFATHFTDEETGLVYFGHRYYSPTTGRWLSREPLGETESFNLYDYSHGDPVNKVDRLGLATVMIDGKASSTVESLWEEVTDTVRSTPASTVAKAGVPPDLIRLAVTAAYMDATRPPPPPGNWSADSSIDMWALNASVREIDAARMSGKFDKRTNEMLKRISQAKSRAVIDVQLIEGTTNGLLFMTQPETAVLKAGGLLLGAAKGISAAGKFARAGDDVVGVAAKNVFWSGGRVAEDAARNFANAKNGIIIGDTAAGRTLAQATQGLPWSQARPQWLSLSEDFARCASGEVNVFQNARGLSLDSIWRSEYKILRQNSDVTGINYHIVMPDGSVSEFR